MTAIERVPWNGPEGFLARLDWRQGEHVSLIGPTGTGKTTLALEILPRRQWVVAIGTKPRDTTLQGILRPGRTGRLARILGTDEGGSGDYARIGEWPPPLHTPRVVLWPRVSGMTAANRRAIQAEIIGDALAEIFTAGAWCVFADEVWYLCKRLGLTEELEELWTQGRSIGISLVAATQRPAYVPLYMYDQATHLFFWADNDEANLRRVGGIGSLSPRIIRETVAQLAPHDVLYVNARSGAMCITRVEKEAA